MDKDMVMYAISLAILGALALVLGFYPAYAYTAEDIKLSNEARYGALQDPGYLPLPPECKFTPGPTTLPTHGPILVVDGLPVLTLNRTYFGF